MCIHLFNLIKKIKNYERERESIKIHENKNQTPCAILK